MSTYPAFVDETCLSPRAWSEEFGVIEEKRQQGMISPYELGFLDAAQFEPYQPESYYHTANMITQYAFGYNACRPTHPNAYAATEQAYKAHEAEMQDQAAEIAEQRGEI